MKSLGHGLVLGAVMLASLGAAQAQTVVKVGVVPAGVPLAGVDAVGKPTGAGVEVLEAIAKGAGWQLQYVTLMGSGSDPFVAAFNANQIDVEPYTFQITAARKAQYDFSDPVLSYGEAIVVPKSDPKEYKSASDLKGMNVGVVTGSNYVDIARNAGAAPIIGDSLPDAMADVNAGKLQAAMGSAPTIILAAQTGPYPNLRVVTTYKSNAALPAGMGVKKGNTALLAALNAELAKLKADGTVAKILAKYGL